MVSAVDIVSACGTKLIVKKFVEATGDVIVNNSVGSARVVVLLLLNLDAIVIVKRIVGGLVSQVDH